MEKEPLPEQNNLEFKTPVQIIREKIIKGIPLSRAEEEILDKERKEDREDIEKLHW